MARTNAYCYYRIKEQVLCLVLSHVGFFMKIPSFVGTMVIELCEFNDKMKKKRKRKRRRRRTVPRDIIHSHDITLIQ